MSPVFRIKPSCVACGRNDETTQRSLDLTKVFSYNDTVTLYLFNKISRPSGRVTLNEESST